MPFYLTLFSNSNSFDSNKVFKLITNKFKFNKSQSIQVEDEAEVNVEGFQAEEEVEDDESISTANDPLLPSVNSHPNSYGTITNNNSNLKQQSKNKNNQSSNSSSYKLRSKLLFTFISLLLGLCIYSSFQDDFLDLIEAKVSCGTCLGLLIPLQALAHVGDDAFVDFFVQGCIKLNIEDEDVCRGAVGTQAPILAHDLRSISLSSYAAKHFCSTVFGLCPLQSVVPYSVQFTPIQPGLNELLATLKIEGREGEVLVGDKSRKEWKSAGKKPFKVVHLSDVHIDRSYVPGSDTICSKNICCRNYGPNSIGPQIQFPAGRFGDRHCDTPVDLVKSMFNAIEEQVPDKAFTIFTGDAVEAAVWLADEKEVTEDLNTWYSELTSISYPSFGNHDTAPVNSFPRSTTSKAANSTQWIFNLAAKDWEKWIGTKAAESVRKNSGCYSKKHDGTNLRIISLNTNYYYKQNFWLYDSDEPQWDPNGVLSWLSNELHQSELLGERVWIIGHMPFGKVDTLRDQSNYANQIFQRYSNTIAAHFYGHSHVDEFEIAYSNYQNQTAGTANGISFISGALTPISGNPVFRVYEVDPDTYEIMDFIPHVANQSEPSFNLNPIWKPYYSARESYNSYLDLDLKLKKNESLNPSFWHRITEKMEVNQELFNLFNTRLSRGGKVEDCSTNLCKNNTICMMRSMRSENNCASMQIGFSFKDKKRDTESVTEPDHKNQEQSKHNSNISYTTITTERHRHNDFHACEGPGLGSMIRKLSTGFTFRSSRRSKSHLLEFRDNAKAKVLELKSLNRG